MHTFLRAAISFSTAFVLLSKISRAQMQTDTNYIFKHVSRPFKDNHPPYHHASRNSKFLNAQQFFPTLILAHFLKKKSENRENRLEAR